MTTDATEILEQARRDGDALIAAAQTAILGTRRPDGTPEASYAPFILDPARNFYVYVSDLAAHTANLRETGRASLMIIEDEATSSQIFARCRLTFDCRVEPIERHCPEWERRLDALVEKFGPVATHLRTMADFHLFRCRPQSGRLVTGFGRAFEVGGQGMREVRHRSGPGSGHLREEKP